nr:uncharacterized protein LOC113739184 [Coffea arabica]
MTVKFNFVLCFLEKSKDIDALSIDELQSSLLVHEKKINQQKKEEQALKVSTESHSTWRGGRGKGRDLKTNLLIVGQLLEKGYEISIKDRPIEEIPPDGSDNVPSSQTVVEDEGRPQRIRKRPALVIDYKEWVFIDQPPSYVKVENEHKIGVRCRLLIVCLNIDDLIFTRNNSAMFEKFKKSMMAEFDMSDFGKMHYFLGIEVVQYAAKIFVSQRQYVQEILNRFQMKNHNSASTPVEVNLKLIKESERKRVDSTLYKQIVGKLVYLTATRPDIMHVVSFNSKYMENPRETHLLVVKKILQYLLGTIADGLFYKNSEKSDLFGFTDNNYAGDLHDRKNTFDYIFMMGSTVISWCLKK